MKLAKRAGFEPSVRLPSERLKVTAEELQEQIHPQSFIVRPLGTPSWVVQHFSDLLPGNRGMVKHSEFMLVEEHKTLEQVAAKLNETPFKALDYGHPREHFVALDI